MRTMKSTIGLIPGVLTDGDCARLLALIERLETPSYLEDERLRHAYNGRASRPTLEITAGGKRLNGLPRLDRLFDQLIDHPGVLSYLEASCRSRN